MEGYSPTFPQEKTYIHTDRKYYAPEEIIWFQAYLSTGRYNEPSPLSNNIYVELYSSEKLLIDHKLVRADGEFGNGSFDLPDSLQSGSYVLRAYTNWMRNFDKAFFFEGGNLVLGVALKAIDASGKGVDISGIRYDNEGMAVGKITRYSLELVYSLRQLASGKEVVRAKTTFSTFNYEQKCKRFNSVRV